MQPQGWYSQLPQGMMTCMYTSRGTWIDIPWVLLSASGGHCCRIFEGGVVVLLLLTLVTPLVQYTQCKSFYHGDLDIQ